MSIETLHNKALYDIIKKKLFSEGVFMRYNNIRKGVFLSRPNRFIANVLVNSEECVCHVKNTGRLGELLKNGAAVYLEESSNPLRKTKYDLVAAEKDGELFNIDSYAPNLAAGEYLKELYPDCRIRAEVKYGNSRFDFCIEDAGKRTFVEVKGVTLIKDGVALFPDAPTERGVKHINELIGCVAEGCGARILFVVQTENVQTFSPNDETHRAFGDALRRAEAAGVEITAVSCIVTPDTMKIHRIIKEDIK